MTNNIDNKANSPAKTWIAYLGLDESLLHRQNKSAAVYAQADTAKYLLAVVVGVAVFVISAAVITALVVNPALIPYGIGQVSLWLKVLEGAFFAVLGLLGSLLVFNFAIDPIKNLLNRTMYGELNLTDKLLLLTATAASVTVIVAALGLAPTWMPFGIAALSGLSLLLKATTIGVSSAITAASVALLLKNAFFTDKTATGVSVNLNTGNFENNDNNSSSNSI